MIGRASRSRAGQRAAVVMSLIPSAKLNGHDAYCYLKDVLERLTTQPVNRGEELLPHRWQPASAGALDLLSLASADDSLEHCPPYLIDEVIVDRIASSEHSVD